MAKLEPIVIPDDFNYIAAFLTLKCNLRCSYCINAHGRLVVNKRFMGAGLWIRGLNRIVTRPDLPITLQGGEPLLYRGVYDVINGVNPDTNIDILTNLCGDLGSFMKKIHPNRLRRESKYASIRVSYHQETMDLEETFSKVRRLLALGYSVGVWVIDHPEYEELTKKAIIQANKYGIDLRLKEFLGVWEGKTYGTFRYMGAVNGRYTRHCECRTSELLIGPGGNIFRCHHDLYANVNPIGHILDPTPPALGQWRPCDSYGRCNACDLKLKTNRFQEFGHCSVGIRNIKKVEG